MAVFSVLFISFIVTRLSKMNFSKATHEDYIMVVQRVLSQNDSQVTEKASELLNQYNVKWNIRSSLVDQDNSQAETTYSIFFKKTPPKSLENLVREISGLENINKVTMLSPETNLFA